ncbi:iron complex transport system substrate-binding protein [Oikeobacillus pervagus]|uniref:Iron complex transport system substrate-binding protein n=2 Tax=Oikeobacillus pervagus TaxID=1325931 RepID=A0AAJ1SYJ7_9BACI|nr:iron complex transport system substrate-binding protein [Oikeobacillus pervagus]
MYMRIVSICPSNTELVGFLGLTDQLVGVDNYSDWPESVNLLPRLGSDLDINMDELEKLNPDIVLASLSVPGMEKNIERLKERNLPYIVTNPQSFEEIGESLKEVGKVCGALEKAEEFVEIYLRQLSLFKQAAQEIREKPTLYWEWWPKPVFSPGKINWLTELSEAAGAMNLFADQDTSSHKTEWSEVLEKNPDYILLAWVGVRTEKINPAIVKKRPGWTELPAVKNHKIFVMEEELYCRPSPRLIKGLHQLGTRLHPEVYKDIPLHSIFG